MHDAVVTTNVQNELNYVTIFSVRFELRRVLRIAREAYVIAYGINHNKRIREIDHALQLYELFVVRVDLFVCVRVNMYILYSCHATKKKKTKLNKLLLIV